MSPEVTDRRPLLTVVRERGLEFRWGKRECRWTNGSTRRTASRRRWGPFPRERINHVSTVDTGVGERVPVGRTFPRKELRILPPGRTDEGGMSRPSTGLVRGKSKGRHRGRRGRLGTCVKYEFSVNSFPLLFLRSLAPSLCLLTSLPIFPTYLPSMLLSLPIVRGEMYVSVPDSCPPGTYDPKIKS